MTENVKKKQLLQYDLKLGDKKKGMVIDHWNASIHGVSYFKLEEEEFAK
jgi:hypothetical protein